MKTSIDIELKPFTVPNFVIADNDLTARQEGCEHPKFPLQALSSETLQRLCDQFAREVFKKAGKSPPPQEAPVCPRCSNLKAVR